MFSYAGKTQAEISKFQQKVFEDRENKYGGKIDNNTLRWTSGECVTDATYLPNAQQMCVHVGYNNK